MFRHLSSYSRRKMHRRHLSDTFEGSLWAIKIYINIHDIVTNCLVRNIPNFLE